MEPIFAQLSLEYFKAGKTLPWNKVANPERPVLLFEGELDMIRADVSKAKSRISQYFNL